MTGYKVRDLMVRNPEVIDPSSTLQEAAEAMARIDCGIMPVGTADKLVGMVTDRDIALRAVAKGRDPSKTKISDIMTHQVYAVTEDAPLDEAVAILKKHSVNRLIVKNNSGKMIGILSLSGLIRETADQQIVSEFVAQLAQKNHTAKAA